MTTRQLRWPVLVFAFALASALLGPARAQTGALDPAKIKAEVSAEFPKFMTSLEAICNIESGSADLEGLARMERWVTDRLKAAGMEVESIPMKAPADHILLKGATLGNAVYGRLKGTGSKKVLLIAHMDTVYPRGTLAKQPFRIDGNRAYGLAIADDKNGVALIVHTIEMLQRLGHKDYAELAVLINGDEEVGSPGSGALLTKLGGEYDAVFSYEGGGTQQDWVRLATSSIAIATLKVTGKASHAGANPDAGRNALYELAHQLMKTRAFGDPAKGLRLNWTVARAGQIRNVIPDEASATADIRANANQDMDQMERELREAIKETLIPDTKVELEFLRSRPAFVANDAARALARHAVGIFKEIDKPLEIRERPTGGGTDAAFAGLRPKGGVLESFGLRGYGAHTSDNEYVFIDSVEPRLYMSIRMVMDVGRGLVRW
jgi:glutamate carboxypeptidase